MRIAYGGNILFKLFSSFLILAYFLNSTLFLHFKQNKVFFYFLNTNYLVEICHKYMFKIQREQTGWSTSSEFSFNVSAIYESLLNLVLSSLEW